METPFRAFGGRHLDQLLRERTNFDGEERLQAQAVAAVLPFRINQYVLDELIDWSAVPNDPIYRLTFPQPGMLVPADLDRMVGLLRSDAAPGEVAAAVHQIRRRLNPHPAGQLDQNTPYLEGERLSGMQHKYRETLLVSPRQGQTCHASCSYCFRWPQFVGDQELKIATDDVATMVNYLHRHPEITSVLITGGDPLIMRTAVLRRYLEPLLAIDTVESIRIGTKALSYWPPRVLPAPGAADLLALFRQVVAAGKHLAVMGHYSHPRELEPAPAREAVARVLATGAVIRSQAPMIRGVNDDADAWARLWREQTRLSIVPYYMFM